MATRTTQKFWLKVTAIIIASFAPVMFLGTMPATTFPAEFTVDFLWLPIDGAQDFNAPATRFLSALIGGFLLGWGVTIYLLSGAPFDAAPEAIRRAVLAGVCSWFILDSMGSYASGATSNVFFNILILIAAIGPLWRPAIDTGKAV